MCLPDKILTDMATYGSTSAVRAKIVASLTRQKIDLRTYFENSNSPAIVRTWWNEPAIQAWVQQVEEARQGTASNRGAIENGMSHQEECDASIALMSPHFKKCHFGRGGLRIYHVVDEEKKLLAPVERNDDEEFTITGVLKPRLRELNCILPVRKIRAVKEWWLLYGDDIERPKLCAQPDQDVWCMWKIPIRPDAEALERFHDDLIPSLVDRNLSKRRGLGGFERRLARLTCDGFSLPGRGISEDGALVALREMAPAIHGFFSRLSDPAALASFHWGVYSDE